MNEANDAVQEPDLQGFQGNHSTRISKTTDNYRFFSDVPGILMTSVDRRFGMAQHAIGNAEDDLCAEDTGEPSNQDD